MLTAVIVGLSVVLLALLILWLDKKLHARLDAMEKNQINATVRERDGFWHMYKQMSGHLQMVKDALVAPWKREREREEEE